MVDKLTAITRQLSSLLGSQYVIPDNKNLVVKPSSTEELAEILKLAAKANMFAAASGYEVGPAAQDTGKADILISLERMNQITIDHNRSIITAQPTAKVSAVINDAGNMGYIFPGTACQNKHETIGQNIAACFKEGEPDFKCHNACLCGLELVLTDGRIVTIGEKSAKDMDNYQLTYIMGSYSEEKAVISSVHLKLLSQKRDRYWLITAFKDMDTILETMPTLTNKHREDLSAIVGINLAEHSEFGGLLGKWAPGFTKADTPLNSCMLLAINCPPEELELILDRLSESLSGDGAADISIATSPHQKITITNFIETLAKNLNDNTSGQLSAVYWDKETGALKLYQKQ